MSFKLKVFTTGMYTRKPPENRLRFMILPSVVIVYFGWANGAGRIAKARERRKVKREETAERKTERERERWKEGNSYGQNFRLFEHLSCFLWSQRSCTEAVVSRKTMRKMSPCGHTRSLRWVFEENTKQNRTGTFFFAFFFLLCITKILYCDLFDGQVRPFSKIMLDL